MRELGADRLPRARAETAVGPGVHPASRLVGLDHATGVGDEVAAVADHDRVAIQDLAKLTVDAKRVERRAIVVEVILFLRALLRLRLAQALDPGSSPLGAGAGRPGSLADRLQRRGDVADQRNLRPAIGPKAARRRVELNEGGLLAERAAEPEPEVERHADDERHVGLFETSAAGATERELVVGRQAPA